MLTTSTISLPLIQYTVAPQNYTHPPFCIAKGHLLLESTLTQQTK